MTLDRCLRALTYDIANRAVVWETNLLAHSLKSPPSEIKTTCPEIVARERTPDLVINQFIFDQQTKALCEESPRRGYASSKSPANSPFGGLRGTRYKSPQGGGLNAVDLTLYLIHTKLFQRPTQTHTHTHTLKCIRTLIVMDGPQAVLYAWPTR